MSQEDREAMLSKGTTPTVVLDRLPLSEAEGTHQNRGQKAGKLTSVHSTVTSGGGLAMSMEKLPSAFLSQLDTPESPRSLSSVDSHSRDIVRGSQQQLVEQEEPDGGSRSSDESPLPQISLISLVRKPKRLMKKKSHTMGF